MTYGATPQHHDPSTFHRVCWNVNEFMDALSNVSVYSIFLAANIDLTGLYMIEIRNKEICSNGATITSKKLFKHPDPVIQHLNCLTFLALENVELNGIGYKGCQGEILDHNYAVGQQGFIRVGVNQKPAPNFQMRNCTVSKSDTWGVFLYDAPGAIIEFNTFSNIRRAGYGYMTWQTSPPDRQGQTAYFRRNRVFNSRHITEGSPYANSIVSYQNLVYGNSTNNNFGRHGDNGIGGSGDILDGNICLAPGSHFGLQENVI